MLPLLLACCCFWCILDFFVCVCVELMFLPSAFYYYLSRQGIWTNTISCFCVHHFAVSQKHSKGCNMLTLGFQNKSSNRICFVQRSGKKSWWWCVVEQCCLFCIVVVVSECVRNFYVDTFGLQTAETAAEWVNCSSLSLVYYNCGVILLPYASSAKRALSLKLFFPRIIHKVHVECFRSSAFSLDGKNGLLEKLDKPKLI